MDNASNKSQEHTQKLSAELKKTFSKLSDSDIALQATNPDKFYEAVKTKQGINKDEAEKTVKKLDSECAASCAANSNMSDSASKPAAKAANA